MPHFFMSREEEFSITSYNCGKTGTTIIVNLQYRKGFLVLISEKGMEILCYFKSFYANYKKGRLITSYSFLVVLS